MVSAYGDLARIVNYALKIRQVYSITWSEHTAVNGGGGQ